MTILLLICSVINFMGMMQEADLYEKYQTIHFLPIRFFSLIAPIVYLFVQSLINPKYKFERWMYLLFFPFAIDYAYQLYELARYLSGNLDFQENKWLHYFVDNTFETIAAIFNIVVIVIAIKMIWSYEKSLYNEYAEVSDKSLKWLFNTLIGGLLLTIFWFGISIDDYFPEFLDINLGWILWLGVSILIYWIGYSMLMRPEIFIVEKLIEPDVVPNEEPKLSDKTDEHYQRLLVLMKEEELFRNSNLNMDMLSKSIGLSKGYVSQIINTKEGKNFFDFVNSYRVEDVKQKLSDSSFDHYNILGIALDAGFKSKSTFNSVFKKMCGETPSQFKRDKNK